jgi:hypothetical protein
MLKALLQQLDKIEGVAVRVEAAFKAVRQEPQTDEELERLIKLAEGHLDLGTEGIDHGELHHRIVKTRNFLPPNQYGNFI